ncbi:MAG: ABC transporter ATP-binding protein [Pseudomonadota bacterium]
MTEPLVRIEHVCMAFGDTVAVDDVSLDIAQGQFVVLLGPSGSGKTTVLNILGGFLEPTAGRVLIAGDDVTSIAPARRPTTTVFQDYALFPHMSVAANVGFGLAMRKIGGAERRQRVGEALAMVGLGEMGSRRVHELSGGQRQRIALARALVVNPSVLLLDEPLGALDLNLRRQMQEELLHIQRRLGTTFVHVTHDQDEAMNIADTIVVMNDGRIEDVGPPDRIYLKPRTRFVATFMGESNILAGRVTDAAGGRVSVETSVGVMTVEGDSAVGSDVHLSIRPEQLSIGSAGGDAIGLGRATVSERAFNGSHMRCHAKGGPDGRLDFLLHLPQRSTVEPGQEIELAVAEADVVLLTD